MGFELKEKQFLKNINSLVYLYIHKKTKAKLLFFENNDINKSFSISFKTIPYNNNGIFHILEHSVLCGSEKYPVKEPFVELIKGSFNTFINAMTFPDKTMYPVSSKNNDDLKILMDIYLDAVFNPKLISEEKILKQEGWHYHLEKEDDNLIYKGVVYNEMKGVYSSVEEILDMHISETLYKNTPYEYSYGGKPDSIHSITQKEFVETYKKCYHPSNSFICLYGDLSIEQYLEKIDSYLNNYEYVDYSNYKINSHTIKNPIKKEFTYFSEDVDDKNYLAINYLLDENSNFEIINSIDIINELLLGNSNSEFKKYFIDNNICEDVYGYLQKDRLQVAYSIVFKNVKNNFLNALEKEYENKLQEIINKKFDKKYIQAIINKNNFSIKEEVNKVSSPKGVLYAIRALRAMNYENNPFEMFNYDSWMTTLEENLHNNKFEDIATKYLFNNNQKSVVVLKPTNKKDNKEEQELEKLKNNFSNEEINNIVKETKELIEWQNRKDKKEDLEKIKSVDAKKVNIKNPLKETSIKNIDDIKFAYYDEETNDIAYAKLLFDITSFNIAELQYTTILSYLLFNINTKNKSELENKKNIDFNLGGISSAVKSFRKFDSDDVKVKLIISSKNLSNKTDKLIEILEENTFNIIFDNKSAIYNILLELKLNLENKFKNQGHSFVIKRLESYNSLFSKINEHIAGYDFYLFISDIVDNFDKKYEELKNKLENIKNKLFTKNNLLISFTGNNILFEKYCKHIKKYVNFLSFNNYYNKVANSQIPFEKKEINYSEGYYFDTYVNYVGQLYNIEKYNGALLILSHILDYDYLWNNVRVKGGAYGVFININNFKEVVLCSYRDPNLTQTLNTYNEIYSYIKNLEIDDETLNKYKIGTLNFLDQLLSPNEKASISLINYINEKDLELYNKLVAEIKETTLEEIKGLAYLFKDTENKSYKCVISSKEEINKNKILFNKITEIK